MLITKWGCRQLEKVKRSLFCHAEDIKVLHLMFSGLLPRGWSGLWWAGTPAQGRTVRHVRYRSSFPSRSSHRWQSGGWEGFHVQRCGLWPGTGTSGGSAVGSGCWSPWAAVDPPPRMDLGTPTSEGCGRSPVRGRGLVSLRFHKQMLLLGRAGQPFVLRTSMCIQVPSKNYTGPLDKKGSSPSFIDLLSLITEKDNNILTVRGWEAVLSRSPTSWSIGIRQVHSVMLLMLLHLSR